MDETGLTDTWAPLRKPDMSVLFDNAMFDSELSWNPLYWLKLCIGLAVVYACHWIGSSHAETVLLLTSWLAEIPLAIRSQM